MTFNKKTRCEYITNENSVLWRLREIHRPLTKKMYSQTYYCRWFRSNDYVVCLLELRKIRRLKKQKKKIPLRVNDFGRLDILADCITNMFLKK